MWLFGDQAEADTPPPGVTIDKNLGAKIGMFQLSGQKHLQLWLAFRRAYTFIKSLPLRRCTLCDAHGHINQNLCQSCASELPKNMYACTSCAHPLEKSSGSVCKTCWRTPPPWDHCHTPTKYEIPASYLVKRFKYHGDMAAGVALAEQMWVMAGGFREHLVGAVFIAVPLHKDRKLERGFNQSEILATWLAHRCGGIVLRNRLTRTRPTCPQAGLSKRARAANLKNAFHIKEIPKNKHIVLIDDVLTTGCTAHECCRVLRKAGAAELTLWCFARAYSPK